MIVLWRGDVVLADQEALAALHDVSVRTVRRHLTPVDSGPRRAPLYDALAAEPVLAAVTGRAARDRDAEALRRRARALATRIRMDALARLGKL